MGIKGKVAARVHLGLAFVWAVLWIPTVLFWPESVLWVATMSLYANFVGHWSAFQAARSEYAQEKKE